jgi:hypothetical protein
MGISQIRRRSEQNSQAGLVCDSMHKATKTIAIYNMRLSKLHSYKQTRYTGLFEELNHISIVANRIDCWKPIN